MQADNVLAFPSPEDQLVIQTAVETFLLCQTGKTREVMLKTIRAVLDGYRITRFSFADYNVYSTGDYPWAIIRAKNAISGNNCPGCGNYIYHFRGDVRILNIDEQPRRHFVTYGCRCGKVFGKWENISD
ncbi:hypothetical protein IT084_09125 [Desulfallas sp. Bu1-1]|uniref:hypothetical protein n=1 Tax=Desulfallas sp. Bu1-1 TaxID=2787620 RepID=UPI0018A01170|nr:hypothetical protein [Desulfallas sp. Bu1-1]MBF7083133.1 hypothetical protein [Desulfallas sp. Bu1-1]